MATRAEKIIQFIETYCLVPEGVRVGLPFILDEWQKDWLKAVFDNPNQTRRGLLSIARKNGKTGLIAGVALAFICGPEAKQNAKIYCGANSADQARILFNDVEKMVRMNPKLEGRVHIQSYAKKMTGLKMGVEFRALAAEAANTHGLRPYLSILDEIGEIRGANNAFIEAIETAQGVYPDSIILAMSTQSANDGDLFSTWIDDAVNSQDPQIVCKVYAAPVDCDLEDEDAWRDANPALGTIKDFETMRSEAAKASRMPTAEADFRRRHLNQRVNADNPFVTKQVWDSCVGDVVIPEGSKVWVGLDLSAVTDLTCLGIIGRVENKWVWNPWFWLPNIGLIDKAATDRVPYVVWRDSGFLNTTPTKTIDYAYPALKLVWICETYDVQAVSYDPWNWQSFKNALVNEGFDFIDDETARLGDKLIKFVAFRQGFKTMSPALSELERDLLDGKFIHNNNPVMNMCAGNATIMSDPAGNRKLVKPKETFRRIDGMIALTNARGIATFEVSNVTKLDYSEGILFV
jgi:phage terminase large subunit-like protein